MDKKKLLVLAVLAAAVVSFFAFDLGQYLTLENLKANKGRLEESYARYTLLFVAAYILIYIVQTTFSLPGAAILTLAGGAVFGSVLGALYAAVHPPGWTNPVPVAF